MNKEFKTLPILTTDRLTLRQLSKSDSGEILQLRSNPETNKFLDRKLSKTLDDALSFITNIIRNESDEIFYWAITKTGNKKLIGTICLFELSNDPKKCEIGYELLTDYQRQGIMAEAVKRVIEYASKTLGLKMIDAITHKDNKSSTELLLKLDFKQFEMVNEENSNLILFRLEK